MLALKYIRFVNLEFGACEIMLLPESGDHREPDNIIPFPAPATDDVKSGSTSPPAPQIADGADNIIDFPSNEADRLVEERSRFLQEHLHHQRLNGFVVNETGIRSGEFITFFVYTK